MEELLLQCTYRIEWLEEKNKILEEKVDRLETIIVTGSLIFSFFQFEYLKNYTKTPITSSAKGSSLTPSMKRS